MRGHFVRRDVMTFLNFPARSTEERTDPSGSGIEIMPAVFTSCHNNNGGRWSLSRTRALRHELQVTCGLDTHGRQDCPAIEKQMPLRLKLSDKIYRTSWLSRLTREVTAQESRIDVSMQQRTNRRFRRAPRTDLIAADVAEYLKLAERHSLLELALDPRAAHLPGRSAFRLGAAAAVFIEIPEERDIRDG